MNSIILKSNKKLIDREFYINMINLILNSRNLITTLFLIYVFSPLLTNGKEPTTDTTEKVNLTVFVSYNQYRMQEFNKFLLTGNNKAINGGYNFGLELGIISFELSGKVVGIGGKLSEIKLPIGLEYLNARSKTKHIQNNIIVDWNFPVFGVYITPDIIVPLSKKIELGIRPISFGYYFLGIGNTLKASLTVSDRQGNLKLSGSSVGFKAGISGRILLTDNVFAIIRGDYRFLNFTNVNQKCEDGFTLKSGGQSISSTDFIYDLDFSGFSLFLGVLIYL